MDYFDALLRARAGQEDTGSIVSRLLSAEIKGRKLTHEELLSYCYLLFVAGLDTSAWAIRSSLWYLAQHADAQARLRENPDLIPAAAEEFLRTLSPVQAMARTCKKDTEVSGQKIRAGESGWCSSSGRETVTPGSTRTPMRSFSTAKVTGTSRSAAVSTDASDPIWAGASWSSRSRSSCALWAASRSPARTSNGTASAP